MSNETNNMRKQLPQGGYWCVLSDSGRSSRMNLIQPATKRTAGKFETVVA
jgi:hypothetical protein